MCHVHRRIAAHGLSQQPLDGEVTALGKEVKSAVIEHRGVWKCTPAEWEAYIERETQHAIENLALVNNIADQTIHSMYTIARARERRNSNGHSL